MQKIETIDALEALYGTPPDRALSKVADHVTPLYRRWIEASRFCILSTVGPEGTDATPRGDHGPVVRIVDPTTIRMPDWQGNNRLDALRNIVRDGRASLMFMIAGNTTVVRVNGRAAVTADPAITGQFEQRGKHPRTVVQITVAEVYFQCAKALMRAELWADRPAPSVPTPGQFLAERDASFDGAGYDAGYADYARSRMW